jgi:hypothetical protein
MALPVRRRRPRHGNTRRDSTGELADTEGCLPIAPIIGGIAASGLTLVKSLVVRLAPYPALTARITQISAQPSSSPGFDLHDGPPDGNVRGRNPAWNQVIME